MESKDDPKPKEEGVTTNQKTQTKSQDVKISEKIPEQKNPKNNFYISYKDLFINLEKEQKKEKEESKSDSNSKPLEKKSPKNEEDIKMI